MNFNEIAAEYELTFFMPTKAGMEDLGGAQSLFLQIAKFISQNYAFRINFIDTENGRISSKLNGIPINLIYYKKDQKIKLTGKQVVITSLVNLRKVSECIEGSNESRFFFWNLGTSDFNNNFALMRFYSKMPIQFRKTLIRIFESRTKRNLEKLLKLLITKNAIAFMSGKNYKFLNKYINTSEEPIYLPVAITGNESPSLILNNRNGFISPEILNLGWLGRFAKTETIKLIIESIAGSGIPTLFHIIGWGTDHEKETLLNFAEKKNVQIKIVEGLYNEALNEYLTSNLDLGIAMGMSLLNFASLRIPVIATEHVYKKKEIKGFLNYKWFFELKNFDLATSLIFSKDQENVYKLDHFLEEITVNYEYHAIRCYGFYKNNYLFSSIVTGLIKNSISSKLAGSDLNQIQFLLKDNNFHKIIKSI